MCGVWLAGSDSEQSERQGAPSTHQRVRASRGLRRLESAWGCVFLGCVPREHGRATPRQGRGRVHTGVSLPEHAHACGLEPGRSRRAGVSPCVRHAPQVQVSKTTAAVMLALQTHESPSALPAAFRRTRPEFGFANTYPQRAGARRLLRISCHRERASRGEGGLQPGLGHWRRGSGGRRAHAGSREERRQRKENAE